MVAVYYTVEVQLPLLHNLCNQSLSLLEYLQRLVGFIAINESLIYCSISLSALGKANKISKDNEGNNKA